MGYAHEQIKNGFRAYYRAGPFIKDVFAKADKTLTPEECMNIYNWYGIRSRDVALLALSHGFELDTEGFARLIDEQEERSKNTIQCIKEEGRKELLR